MKLLVLKRSLPQHGCITCRGTCCHQVGAPAEEDLVAWGHHRDLSTVPDAVMQRMDPAIVSFVFSCKARPCRS